MSLSMYAQIDLSVSPRASRSRAERSLCFESRHPANSGKRWVDRNMRRSNVALRLQTSLLEEAKRVAESEGAALNQLINVAVAEKCRRCSPRSTSASGPVGPTSPKRSVSSRKLAAGNLLLLVTRCDHSRPTYEIIF